MELRPPSSLLPSLLHLYLLLSLPVLQTYGTTRPPARLAGGQESGGQTRQGGEQQELDSGELQDRSGDVYEHYQEQEESFRPSVRQEEVYGQRVAERRQEGGRYRQERYRQVQGGRRRVEERRVDERRVDERRVGGRQRPAHSPYSRGGDVVRPQAPRQRWRPEAPAPQAWPRPKQRPQASLPVVGLSGFDYGDYGEVQEAGAPTNKKPGLFDSIFGLLKPKKPGRPLVEVDSSRPSWEFVQENNEIDLGEKVGVEGTDQFVPTNSEYDDYNLNYVDEEAGPKYPQYTMKDVIHSIKNNESRVETLKKFLSAASAMTDRAGTDPVFMLWSMPLTLLSFLGVFYAVSAVAVLGYKYVLLTSGSNNGQAVAVLPVVLLFTVPLVLVTVFLVARGSLDGQINLGRLARGDLQNTFRQDFESVDFVYDLGVGATALLGLGWMVSITL